MKYALRKGWIFSIIFIAFTCFLQSGELTANKLFNKYCMVQNFEGEILTILMNFQQFINFFPIKIFHLGSYLPLMNLS